MVSVSQLVNHALKFIYFRRINHALISMQISVDESSQHGLGAPKRIFGFLGAIYRNINPLQSAWEAEVEEVEEVKIGFGFFIVNKVSARNPSPTNFFMFAKIII